MRLSVTSRNFGDGWLTQSNIFRQCPLCYRPSTLNFWHLFWHTFLVFFEQYREGSDVLRNAKTGEVSAEILLGPQSDPVAILASFSSQWQLATGTVFDVECRDASTGDGAFLSISGLTKGKSISELPASFFLERIFGSSGRFSFYGTPTDIKVKKSRTEGEYRFIDVTFSNLSQSTQTEIPRNAVVVATIPKGTEQAVMLVGSSTATRWRKGSEDIIRKTAESFRAVAAPKSGLKVRAKKIGFDLIEWLRPPTQFHAWSWELL